MRAHYIPVGWYQLRHQKFRLLAAVAGITFAVVLMLVQQGFREALFVSSVRWHTALNYQLVIISPKTDFLLETHYFPRSRLIQVAGFSGVRSITPVYLEQAEWRNPVKLDAVRKIFVVGFDPTDEGFEGIIDKRQHREIKLPDRVLYDSLARPEFGPVPGLFAEHGTLRAEVNGRNIDISGLFQVGTSFGIDGALLTSDLNFKRLFRERLASQVSLGLVHLADGVDAIGVQKALLGSLPKDIAVMTPAQFKLHEIHYWNSSTPIGYVFTFGVIMGFIVGTIIVYQILYSDVQDHLREYATLKAIGYSNGYLSRVVLQESAILALLGFIPGAALTLLLFKQAGEATNLPLHMTPELAIRAFLLTLVMCMTSGMIAVRKLKSANPADVF